MPVYAYTAVDAAGRQTSGTLTAESRAAALTQVSDKGFSPVSIDERDAAGATAAKTAVLPRVPAAAVESFTRELANLLAAGLPLARALHLLRREAAHPGARKAWAAIHDDVMGGTSLADALARWPKTFSSVYIAMVRAGETGGFLHLVLQQIADFRTREQDLRGKVKAALVYPVVLGVLMVAVVIFLLTYFIPRFTSIFADFGSQLPALTRAIVAVSELLTRHGLIVLVVLGVGIFALRRAAATLEGKRVIERVILKLPAIGGLVAQFALVRFCRMLGTLVAAGVPLVGALRVAKEALGNQTLADAVVNSIREVERGVSLAKSLGGCPLLFPPSVIEMVTVAEETGRLEKELLRLSMTYEGELERRLRMVVALAEPALLFVMAAVIGTVVVGMLLPVFTLQDLVR
jgi:type II secretory pathway component PulF